MAKRKSLAAALQRTQDDVKRLKQATAKQEAARRFKDPQRQRQHTLAQTRAAGLASDAQSARNDKESDARLRKALIPFARHERVLLLGEGNFSFAASIAEHHLDEASTLVATSLDTLEEATHKYADAAENITRITDCEGTVLHGIDATALPNLQPRLLRDFTGRSKTALLPFDVVVFNFPHVAAGIKDQDRNILANQAMLTRFFEGCPSVLAKGGRVAVSLATGPTYARWNLKGLARDAGLQLTRSGEFLGAAFPGYEHRRTRGDAGVAGRPETFGGGKGEAREARWSIFTVREKQEETLTTPSTPDKANTSASAKTKR